MSADLVTLSWCLGEIREAFAQAERHIEAQLESDSEDRAALRAARAAVHQAHGALQVVAIDGVPLVTQEAEQLLDAIERGQVPLDASVASLMARVFQALLEHLEQLLRDTNHHPLYLYPYYRDLLEARGAERVHPADLFFPDLSARLPEPAPSGDVPAAELMAARVAFERGLLQTMRDPASGAGPEAMLGAVELLAGSRIAVANRSFWSVARAYFEALRDARLPVNVDVKRLLARFNLQLRKIVEEQAPVAERLTKDMLYALVGAAEGSPRVDAVRAAFRLKQAIPPDFEQPRYGRLDAGVLRQAREALSRARVAFDKITRGSTSEAAAFGLAVDAFDQHAAHLPAEGIKALAGALRGVADTLQGGRSVEDGLSLELASGILFAEQALDDGARPGSDYDRHGHAMAAHLGAAFAGEVPPDAEPAPWLRQLSQAAQERLTMAAFVSEMVTSLRGVEKVLDTYFRDPAQRAELPQCVRSLHQVSGALRLLGHDDASAGAQAVADKVAALADLEVPADHAECESVASSIGALGFFIESLQHPERTGGRFAFDPQTGEFHAHLGRGPVSGPATDEDRADPDRIDPAGVAPIDAPVVVHETRSAEEILAGHSADAAARYEQLRDTPDVAGLRDELRSAVAGVRDALVLLDDATRRMSAVDALSMLADPSAPLDLVRLESLLTSAGVAISRRVQAAPMPAEHEVDTELLEIFLSEAEEVLAAIEEHVALSRDSRSDPQYLTTIRRGFHTLKGSSRMVGLMQFGDAGWAMEQVMNLWLAEERPGSDALYALIETAHARMSAWVQAMRAAPGMPIDPSALIAAADAMRNGTMPPAERTGTVAFAHVENNAAAIEVHAGPADEMAAQSDAEAIDFDAPIAGEEAVEIEAPVDIEAAIEIEAPVDIEAAIEIEAPVDIDAAIEFDAPIDTEASINIDPPVDVDGPIDIGTPVAPDAPVDIGAALEIDAPIDASSVIDTTTASLDASGPVAAIGAGSDADTVVIGGQSISRPLYLIFLSEADELIQVLSDDIADWRGQPTRGAGEAAMRAVHSLAGSAAVVGLSGVHDIAERLDRFYQAQRACAEVPEPHELESLAFVIERLRAMLHQFAAGSAPRAEPEAFDAMAALLATWLGRKPRARPGLALVPDEVDAQDEDDTLVFAIDGGADEPENATAVFDQVDTELAVEHGVASDAALDEQSAGAPRDELDPDLLPVFIEEAVDYLPQIGENLQRWLADPADGSLPQTLMRHLHTVKGSARMAGAMTLGQQLHDIETRVEDLAALASVPANLIEELIGEYDGAVSEFEAIRDPALAAVRPRATGAAAAPLAAPAVALAAASAAVPAGAAGAGAPDVATESAVVPAMAPQSAQPPHAAQPAQPLVRVRADLLDKLVNEAGEVSIARSRLDNEMTGLRQSLADLTENVNRLRSQLREIEIQADTQIQAKIAQNKEQDRNFDPLEFDRYTRFQELTRMLAESVNDVATVQQNAMRNLDEAAQDLHRQGQVLRDLQQNLMRVRMVQFGSIGDRLYRVVRQAAKELDKRVHLNIRGAGVEVDRGVLEQMAGPIEHLLRNAVAHGVESRERRIAAGKSETGEVTVEVRQEGREIVLSLADDGGGLDYERIRERAVSLDLIAAQSTPTPRELADLIFAPGFTTASTVTEISGRGVGMDVVRSEVVTLGGRIETESTPAQGTRFTIHLPLTLAVSQVVLVAAGKVRFAVPSSSVEQVLQLKPQALAAAYEDHFVEWQGARVPLFYLGTLVEQPDLSPVAQHYSPVVIVRSGHQRIALHCDDVTRNQEVVVKNVGPQVARVRGVSGATVLGNGEIVLIVNPVALAQVAAGEVLDRVVQTPSISAVMAQPLPAVVMVVDDSLTVRKVTQRLLVREGYQVLLAKDGVDALRQMQDTVPDVMLVDIEMPRMDGFDLTRNIRSDDRFRHIPIVMITSRTADKHRNFALSLGVNAYLGKPYSEDEMLGLVASLSAARQSVAAAS